MPQGLQVSGISENVADTSGLVALSGPYRHNGTVNSVLGVLHAVMHTLGT